jgi:hypothetical protein
MTMVLVFESFLFDSTEFYKNFTKEFVDIEKLWDMYEWPDEHYYRAGLYS